MSQENVEIARRGYELMKSGDIAAAVQIAAPDFEFDLSDLYPDAPILHGVDELLRWSDSGPWSGSIHLEPERFIDVDPERVLVLVRVTATGGGSGVPVERRNAHELIFRDGLLVRLKVHADRQAALEAAGLEE